MKKWNHPEADAPALRKAETVEKLVAALKRIAALDDRQASEHLAMTGSYGAFGEPGSVEIARDVLAELGL